MSILTLLSSEIVRFERNMFKSIKGLAVPLEKRLRTELIRELVRFEELVIEGDTLKSDNGNHSELAVSVLPSGRRVYCPNRQNPACNRKHHVRSLLVH
jgi:hypothetical protein